MSLSIAVTGFVSSHAGSVASANAVIVDRLLTRGHQIDFYTKPSFVDPRPVLNGTADKIHVVDCTNHWGDGLRRTMSPSGSGLWGRLWGSIDSTTYNRGLVQAMRTAKAADLDLWLGDWARGRGSRPVVSFVQGPPGTDARSVFQHQRLITELAGRWKCEQLKAFARYRLGRGLPTFAHSDHVIVGSQWSRRCLVERYGLAESTVHAMPYPIDLDSFQPAPPRPRNGRLRIFWLGRFVPRKRLDLFLDGLGLAIEQGVDAEAWVVGKSGFVPGYEELLAQFPFQDRLQTWESIPRREVPAMLSQVDVMAQPSDEENFGSSVAEALACGVPTIVGATNGTADYISGCCIHLSDDRPETFAEALGQMAAKKRRGELDDRGSIRQHAERQFAPEVVVDQLDYVLTQAIGSVADSAP